MDAPAIRYVAQDDPNGCLVACIAMVAGLTFAESMGHCRPVFRDGLTEFVVDDVLGDLGFAVMCRWMFAPRVNAKRDPWPVAPFAPVHICGVRVPSGNHHGIVMLTDGTVLDPWDRERTSLAHPDYREISRVSGYWKVRP